MKITMYELLGLIKDGKAPKKILLNGIVFEYQGDDYLYKDEDKKEHWLFSAGYTDKYMWLENFLKAEVEIIEEPKKIEKLNTNIINANRYDYDKSKEMAISNITADFLSISKVVNEIIDEINNLKEND